MTKEKREKYEKLSEKLKMKFFLLTLALSLPLIASYMEYSDMKEIKALYYKDKTFICKSSNMKIQINRSEGWGFKDNHFIKDDSKVYMYKCKEK